MSELNPLLTHDPEARVIPSIGRIVHYTLDDDDAEAVNRRRTDAVTDGQGGNPNGTIVHFGAHVTIGDVFPMIITKVLLADDEFFNSKVNGQVQLDGNDTLWVTGTTEGSGPGHYTWPRSG